MTEFEKTMRIREVEALEEIAKNLELLASAVADGKLFVETGGS